MTSVSKRRRRRWVIAVVLLLCVAAGAAVIAGGALGGGAPNGSRDNQAATVLARVQRRTLSTQQQFTGTLGYRGSYSVLARARGTITWLPTAGRVIKQGQVLYRVNGAPVVLLYGSTPAYRPLAGGSYASDVTGRDVAQLNHDLVALGYANKSDLDAAWTEFSWATRAAVERLQKHLHVQQTGKVPLGKVVFLPTAARITGLPVSLGSTAVGQVLSATSTVRTVRVALDASLQAEVRAGDRVMITLPDGHNTPGRVSSVGTVATVPTTDAGGQSSGPTVPVTIRLTRPSVTGRLDQAVVEVSITDRTVRNVLAVKVTALVALAGGGYAVEIVESDGTHQLVPVTPGLFDDGAGLVQVSGPGLAAGQRVVVPGNA